MFVTQSVRGFVGTGGKPEMNWNMGSLKPLEMEKHVWS